MTLKLRRGAVLVDSARSVEEAQRPGYCYSLTKTSHKHFLRCLAVMQAYGGFRDGAQAIFTAAWPPLSAHYQHAPQARSKV